MSISLVRTRRICGIVLEIALGIFLVAMLLTAWKTPESQAGPSKVKMKNAAVSREALLPVQGTVCMFNCPANITSASATAPCGATVSFATPTATAACGSPTGPVSCAPSSGSCFPLGTTTVTCTFPRAVGNLTCTFTVTVLPFDICLQDDYSSNILRINSQTGAYEFTNCQGITLTGTGTISRLGDVVYLQQSDGDRIVNASLGAYPNYGTATITSWSLGRNFSITDSNITNNTCSCP